MAKLTVIVENNADSPFIAEHGLALLIDFNDKRILFDTGAGGALVENAKLLNIDINSVTHIILSHGHNDHTGGLCNFSEGKVYSLSDVVIQRFSIHENSPVHDISMPKKSVEKLQKLYWIHSDSPLEIFDGAFLSGRIPRISGEDVGGPFYLDETGCVPDSIIDEQALLLSSGLLVQGCCHAGIVNTMRHFKMCCPDIEIRAIVGGLHLLHASIERLQQTAVYLNNSEVEDLYLMHCTGENAIKYLSENCPNIRVHYCKVGEVILF